MGIRQSTQNPIPLSVVHELGAPRELALRHASLACIAQNLQRSFVVGLDLVLRDPGCALANGQLSAVPGEHHPPRRILLGDHGVDGVSGDRSDQRKLGRVFLHSRQD